MNKFIYHKVLPFVCTLSILVSLLVVPASAASGVGKDTGKDTANRDAWASYITSTDPVFGDLFSKHFNVDVGYRIFFRIIDDVVGRRYGEVDLDELNTICVQLNEAFCNKPISDLYSFVDVTSAIANYTLMTCFRIPNMRFEVVAGGATAGYYRIKDNVSGLYVVNAVGLYPCTPIDGEFTDTDKHNHWVSKDSAEKNLRYSQVMTGADMRQLCTTLQVAGEPAYVGNFGTKYKAIFRDGREVYANPDGYPFVSAADDSEWAVNQTRPDAGVKDENGNDVEELPEENTTGIDLSGMTITLPDGSINFIDKIIYDESTKSYHIDSHDTYNYTTNNYYTWNYYINYTSITYIGQTEEYNKYYEVYYELPDGRDSADLTKEDLEQLNLSVDVIPYGRSADDTSLRSLYHFDGDTKDSSYWNYCTDFTWNKGASLTYMDAGVFDGALYLDETEHDFTLTLPSNIGSSDFTLQFRYYQSATVAPVTDSYITIGGVRLFQFDGAKFTTGSSALLASTPVGTWNEIALVRSNGQIYYYLNGVVLGSVSYISPLEGVVSFHFGSEQQTFKYFDELRIVDFAIASGGANYSPTAVPHDTNLTLVLPDSKVPVADEYWVIESSRDNLLSASGWDYFDSTFVTPLTISNTYNSGTYGKEFGLSLRPYNYTNQRFPYFSYYTNITSFHSGTGGNYLTLSNGSVNGWSIPHYTSVSTSDNVGPTGGLFMCLAQTAGYNSKLKVASSFTGSNSNVYTLSMVDSDANVCSVTIDVTDWYFKFETNNYIEVVEEFNGYRIGFIVGGAQLVNSSYSQFLWAVIQPIEVGDAGEIIYLELTPYEETDLSAEFVESVTLLDKDSLNTPTLAVRTDIDITNYQIGGVRPSIPEKGQVWAMVENDRIVSIQIYNGQAWEGVDGRIWTGQRWIPASSYNIITLQDMYDIVDATPNYEYIYSEAGFWAWWQKSWNAFTEKLFATLGSGGSGGAGASGGAGSSELGKVDLDAADLPSDPTEEDSKTLWQFIVLVVNGGKSVVSGAREMFSGVVSTIPDTMDDITGAFDSGGVAVGVFDGSDPDSDSVESEVLDPWRYR